jgi:hypothetical protein
MERVVQSQTGRKCYTVDQIKEYAGAVDINPNGVVSVYLPNNVGVLAPVQLSSECCKVLGSEYFFDIDSQKCRWAPVKEDICGLKNPFKLVLNPKGNDGSIFYVDEGQTCELSIDFDYLFKVKCESLSEIINPKAVSAPIDNETAVQIKNLENEIQGMIKECSRFTEQIYWYQTEIDNSSYSIICNGSLTTTSVYEKVVPSSLTNFKRTGFTTRSSPTAPFAFDLEDLSNTNLCLTEPDGLSAWEAILGTVNYQAFLNGDVNSFTCKDVSAIINQNLSNALLNPVGPVLFEVCDVPFGTKTDLIKKLNELLKMQENCTSTITSLQTQLTTLTTTTAQETNSGCKTPIEFFETFNVSATLDLVTGGTVQTVATFDLFNTIGNGQLYNYLVAHPDNSGFYVCGDNDVDTTCTPLTLDINGTNTDICDDVMNNLLTSLYDESGLSGTTNGQDTFNTTLPFNSLASKWLHFHTVVTDPAIIALITNQKIKISFEINHACGDFCVLVDEIVLDKNCTQVTQNNIFLTQALGFELDRIRDNKKSWIANTTPENRPFVISNNVGGQSIRQTNYDVNDERLVINSKEIDLDINIANAIETDVWCYLNDNPCLLTATTIPDCVCEERLYTCFKDFYNITTWTGGTIVGGTWEDLFGTLRATRDAWLKAYNEWRLAYKNPFNVEASPFTVLDPTNLSDLTSVLDATTNSLYKSIEKLNEATFGYMLGYTPLLEVDPLLGADKDRPFSHIIKDSCSDIMAALGNSDIRFYPVCNELDELELYIQDTSDPSNLIDLTPLFQYGNTSTSFSVITATTGEYYCTTIGNMINHYSVIQLNDFDYYTPDLIRIGNSMSQPKDLFFVAWDANKGKCMARSRNAFPESFGFTSPLTIACRSLDLSNIYPCCEDYYLGLTGGTCVGPVIEAYPAYMSGVFARDYKAANVKHINQVLLTEKSFYNIGVRNSITHLIPPSIVTMSATTTIYKDSINGDVIYKEILEVESPSGMISEGIFQIPIGNADPNSWYHSPNCERGCDTYPTTLPSQVLSGSTCYLPFFGPGDCTGILTTQGPTIHYTDNVNYYVHIDLVDSSGNTYYATANDFNLKDGQMPITCPSSASTQTLDINDLLANIENKKQKVVTQIKQTADYLAWLGYWEA